MCDDFKNSMILDFDTSDLGRMRYFLGIEVIQNSNENLCVRESMPVKF